MPPIKLTTLSSVTLEGEWHGVDPATPNALRVLLLHGWMDNIGSFDLLIPPLLLSFPTASILALDLVGHGRSSHDPTGNYTIVSYASSVVEGLSSMGWEDNLVLMGHSMGGGIATVIAGAFPDKCRGLALVDSAGPPVRPPTEAPDNLAKALQLKHLTAKRPASVYPTIEEAISARMSTVAAHPHNKFGEQKISRECAEALVRRCMVAKEGGGFTWTFDPRIKSLTPISFGEEAVIEFCQRVSATMPVLLIRARQGWPYSEQVLERRLQALAPKVVVLPGYHHLHRDPETAVQVGEEACQWIKEALLSIK